MKRERTAELHSKFVAFIYKEERNFTNQVFRMIKVLSYDDAKSAYKNGIRDLVESKDFERIVEDGVVPFPSLSEAQDPGSGAGSGIEMAFASIKERLPDAFVVQTTETGGWLVYEGEVLGFVNDGETSQQPQATQQPETPPQIRPTPQNTAKAPQQNTPSFSEPTSMAKKVEAPDMDFGGRMPTPPVSESSESEPNQE